MLTYSPVPSFKSLLHLSQASSEILANPWKDSKDTALFFSKSAWAIACLCQAFAGETAGEQEIWVPAYFCNQSLWPLRQTKIAIRFYPVLENLEPDWSETDKLAHKHSPKLFLLTHFFGQQNDTERARQFCDRTGALLIEDAAHVLKPFDLVGKHADFVFYSLHKLLAIPDGSLLIIRERARSFESLIKATQLKMGFQFQAGHKWLIKRLVQKCIPAKMTKRRESKNPVTFNDQPIASPMVNIPAPSPLSLKLLSQSLKDLGQAARARQKNEAQFREIFTSLPDLKPWPAHGHPDRVPYYAVFQCPNSETAQKYFSQFRAKGLIVQTWPDLAPEVLSSPEQFKTALNARLTLLTFPVHQSLSSSDIQQYSEILKSEKRGKI